MVDTVLSGHEVVTAEATTFWELSLRANNARFFMIICIDTRMNVAEMLVLSQWQPSICTVIALTCTK